MDNVNYNNYDENNLGAVAGSLWRLQNELDDLQNKLSRTVLSFQSLIEEEETGPDVINDTSHEVKNKTSDFKTSRLEEKVKHRLSTGMKEATTDSCKMENTIDDNYLEKLEHKIRGKLDWKTCDYWSLPQWLQDNYYIIKGYRPSLPSFLVCTHSIFRIHTETINIWTHLLGCLIFIVLFLHAALSNLPFEDKLVLSPFFIGAILCLGLSATFHTFHCHSPSVSSLFSRMDYCGITLLIIGSFVPWLYYAFFCNTLLKILYLAGVLSLGICATVLSLSKTFNQPLYRPLRATVFIVFGLSGVIPGVHFIVLDGWEAFTIFAKPLLLTAVLYIAGAIIYAARVPERLFPGKCDILFQSHQFFHVLVVTATLVDYIGLARVAYFVQFGRSNPDFCVQRTLYYSKNEFH